jgi:hypothetical protein
MRIRSIKPSFFIDEEIGNLGFAARLFFQGLWCHADRAGRLEDKPRELEIQILPYDTKKKGISGESLLSELCPKFIIRYIGADGGRYIQIINFLKHQRPLPQEQESAIPPPSDDDMKVVLKYHQSITMVYTKDAMEGKGKEGKGRERIEAAKAEFIPPSLEEVSAYCKSQGNGVDPEAFLAHYNTVGWVYGKNKIPVRDWKSCVTTWKKKAKKFSLAELSS